MKGTTVTTEATIRIQPLRSLAWVNPANLVANDYNPNHVAPRELDLLARSIQENGWTQPIVCTRDNVIVDGFHRWHLATLRADLTDAGMIPVCYLPEAQNNDVDRRLATVRHNRARGTHYVKQMAVIVNELLNDGCDPDEVGTRLGMQPAEVKRLAEFGHSPSRNGADELSKGWKPQQRSRT